MLLHKRNEIQYIFFLFFQHKPGSPRKRHSEPSSMPADISPDIIQLTDDELLSELVKRGIDVGPITGILYLLNIEGEPAEVMLIMLKLPYEPESGYRIISYFSAYFDE